MRNGVNAASDKAYFRVEHAMENVLLPKWFAQEEIERNEQCHIHVFFRKVRFCFHCGDGFLLPPPSPIPLPSKKKLDMTDWCDILRFSCDFPLPSLSVSQGLLSTSQTTAL